MKKSIVLLALFISSAYSMDQQINNPINADWFYYEENPYKAANQLLQDRNWLDAEREYDCLLKQSLGTKYDQNMARINLASCRMAQYKKTGDWSAFDKVCSIPKNLQYDAEKPPAPGQTVLIRTDKVGIGDIAHFFLAIYHLKHKTGANALLSVRKFMHEPLKHPAQEYGVELIDEKEPIPQSVNVVTHLIALLGHLTIRPRDIAPEKPLFTANDSAIKKIYALLGPLRAQSKEPVIAFLGEKRPATLIGGKQLPRNPEHHGRHLDASAFEELLETYARLVLIDCNAQKSRITFNDDEPTHLQMSDEFKDRIVAVPEEATAFDTTIALAAVLSKEYEKEYVGFGADNGPTNIFTRALTKEAQERFAFIIPNPGEYDMRMEGDGEQYTQMISGCPVYKCESPDKQADTILKAYNQITKSNVYCSIL